MKSDWAEIALIWLLVSVVTIGRITGQSPTGSPVEASFGAILAGSIALVSLIQLFRNQADGFVRRLIYVGGGSYLILALATAYIFLKG